MDIGYSRLYPQEPGIFGRTQLLQRQNGIGLNLALGWFFLQKVRAKEVVLSADIFLWLLETLCISDWLNVQHSGFYF